MSGQALKTALRLIDMQEEMALRTRAGRDRANPRAEEHVAAILSRTCFAIDDRSSDDADAPWLAAMM